MSGPGVGQTRPSCPIRAAIFMKFYLYFFYARKVNGSGPVGPVFRATRLRAMRTHLVRILVQSAFATRFGKPRSPRSLAEPYSEGVCRFVAPQGRTDRCRATAISERMRMLSCYKNLKQINIRYSAVVQLRVVPSRDVSFCAFYDCFGYGGNSEKKHASC